MIIKPPKPGLGFGIRDFGFWDLVWLWLGCGNIGNCKNIQRKFFTFFATPKPKPNQIPKSQIPNPKSQSWLGGLYYHKKPPPPGKNYTGNIWITTETAEGFWLVLMLLGVQMSMGMVCLRRVIQEVVLALNVMEEHLEMKTKVRGRPEKVQFFWVEVGW